MNKYHFIFDKINKNKKLKDYILKKYINNTPRLSDIIVVAGGDGFMLKTLKRYQKYNKPFYGVNRGTFGFLMNKFKSFDILKNIINTKQISISPLQVKVVTKTVEKFIQQLQLTRYLY